MYKENEMKNIKVPLFDLRRVIHPVKDCLISEFSESLNDCRFILGNDVIDFENKFAQITNSKFCIGVSSGTDAITAAIMALDLKPGSDILVPSFTFVASASAIVAAGFNPVFVDLERDSFHSSLKEIKKAWTKNTKAIIFVHLFGESKDLKNIKSFCDEESIYLIEDCAQAFGSSAGKYGIMSTFSFFPAKNLGCLGDGGAITTNDELFANKLRQIRTHGSTKKYYYERFGGNYRLDAIQASFLKVLLPEAKGWINKRRNNAAFYQKHLKDISDIVLPIIDDNHSCNQYTIKTEFRDELKRYLDNNQIGNAIYYPYPLHNNKIFKSSEVLSETEKRCKEVLSIPIYPGLSAEERQHVVDNILIFFKEIKNEQCN